MAEIFVSPSPSADTRSADHKVTPEELRKSTMMHIDDVRRVIGYLATQVDLRGSSHDWTKLQFFDEFYAQFSKAQETGDWGKGWYDEIHVVQERHHPESRCPDDVNLIDLLEQIADCVCAGMARTGKFEPRPIDPAILEKAYMNTQKMLAGIVKVRGASSNE